MKNSIDMEKENILKNKDIENDFNSCIACFKNVQLLMKQISNTDYEKEEELFGSLEYEYIRRKQYDEIGMLLGKVCEFVFKYLIKIKHMEIYKNHTYNDFSKTQALFNTGSLKKLVELKYITQEDFDYITSHFGPQDKNKFHNFTYLSMIVERLMPKTYENMKKYYILSYCAKQASIEYIENKRDNDNFIDYYIKLEELLFPNPDRIDQGESDEYIKTMKKVQSECGDAFNRLRYFSNNVEGKHYNIKLMYEYARSLVTFIMEVRNNEDNLLIDPEVLIARRQAIKYNEIIGLDNFEINDIFYHYKYNVQNKSSDLRKDLGPMLLSGYEINEIDEINEKCKQYDIDPLDIYKTGLTIEEILYFRESGWDMFYIDEIAYGIAYDGKRRRTFEQIKELINNLKKGLGEELFNLFISNHIYNPKLMYRYTFDYSGKKRSIEEIQKNINGVHSIPETICKKYL